MQLLPKPTRLLGGRATPRHLIMHTHRTPSHGRGPHSAALLGRAARRLGWSAVQHLPRKVWTQWPERFSCALLNAEAFGAGGAGRLQALDGTAVGAEQWCVGPCAVVRMRRAAGRPKDGKLATPRTGRPARPAIVRHEQHPTARASRYGMLAPPPLHGVGSSNGTNGWRAMHGLPCASCCTLTLAILAAAFSPTGSAGASFAKSLITPLATAGLTP